MELLDLALLPVPTEHCEPLRRLRDRLIAGGADGELLPSQVPAKAPVDVPGHDEWTPDMLARLRDQLRYPLVRRLLDACASRPNEWVPKEEIDALGEKGPHQLRNELSAFTKLIRRLFGDVSWPIEYVKTDEGSRYRMPPATALRWRALDEDGTDVPSHPDVERDPVRQATALLARASEGHDNSYLIMTTRDLLELLREGGIADNVVTLIVRAALHEFNASKLAHLDSTWT